ncbi:Flavohemoprotein [Streptomyces griseoloalbus]
MLQDHREGDGDHSARLRELTPGTRVWAEGPYGALTAQRRSRGKVLLVAGGVGITPMTAVFETLPGASGDITLLYRANSTQDLALWDELAGIADERGARLMYAVNSPDGERPDISAETLARKIPDVERHDVFLCGPPGFAQSVYEALRGAGVPAGRIRADVLGTMVDEPGGLRSALREAVPGADDISVDRWLTMWQKHVEHEMGRANAGGRPYADSGSWTARRPSGSPSTGASPTRTPSHGWPPRGGAWSRGTTRSPGSRGSRSGSRSWPCPTPPARRCSRLNAHAGLRWHQALSAEDARAYKPAPEVYRLALTAAGCPPSES